MNVAIAENDDRGLYGTMFGFMTATVSGRVVQACKTEQK